MVNECNGKGFRMSGDGCPGCPYIEFRPRACTKKRFSRPKGRKPEEGPS
jgi:hypothetical protein